MAFGGVAGKLPKFDFAGTAGNGFRFAGGPRKRFTGLEGGSQPLEAVFGIYLPYVLGITFRLRLCQSVERSRKVSQQIVSISAQRN